MKYLKVLGVFVLIMLLVVIVIGFVRHQKNLPEPSTKPELVDDTATDSDDTDDTPENGQPQKAAVASGTYVQTLESDGRTRTYSIYIPKNYEPNKSYPLVFLLHGGDGSGSGTLTTSGTQSSAQRMLTNLGFTQKADTDGFIVVAPEGIDGNWNDGRGQTEPELNGVDDVAFISDLLASLKDMYAVDAKRVYATGISNGSMLSQRLACELPTTFAAVGLVSGAVPKPIMSSCAANLSVVGIQGTNDPFSPIADSDGTLPSSMIVRFASGGGEPAVASAPETTAFWASELGCDATPTKTKLPVTVEDGTFVTQHTYKNCDNENDLVYYVVDGMGHSWPPNEMAATVKLTGPSSDNIIATDVIWSFFKTQSR